MRIPVFKQGSIQCAPLRKLILSTAGLLKPCVSGFSVVFIAFDLLTVWIERSETHVFIV